MRSTKEQDPTVPQVYGQHTNDVLCSLMSSVLFRDVRSKRFDRNQLRNVKVTQRQKGRVQYLAQGPFRSKIVLVVIHSGSENDDFLESIVRIGTNRGHSIVTMDLETLDWGGIRASLSELSTKGSEIFLCSRGAARESINLLSKLGESSDLTHFVKGVIVFNGTESVSPESLQTIAVVPTLVVDSNSSDLVQVALRNPLVLVVVIQQPEDLLSHHALATWQCRCWIEFAEAESARQRHDRATLMQSKL